MAERYTRLFSLAAPLYAEGSPVIIEAGALLMDTVGGNVLAQLKFKSISPKIIKALTVSVASNDTVGRAIGAPTVHQYLDLDVQRDAEFGQKTAVVLPSANTRAFEVRVLEAAFTDNSVWTAPDGLNWEPLPMQVPLLPNDAELLKQYRMDINQAAMVELRREKDLWFCTCGAANRAGESVCHCCGSSLPAMENADISKLRERYAARLEEERKAAEAKRIAAEKTAKKTKKLLSIAIPAVITIVAIFLVAIKVIIPNSNYNAAVELYDEGKYREAAAAFLALGDYKDSQARCFSAWGEITERQTISTGYYFTVAVKNDGTVVAVGDNEHGQCDISDWTDIVAIACGYDHTIGLKSDGTVVAVGDNEYGQCNVSDWTDIVAIACGGSHTVGLKSDGTVIAVGYNDDSRCDVSDWTDIVAIACGGMHTVGLKSDGAVVAVGNNNHDYGQYDVSNWDDIVAIACGGLHTVGLKSEGTVVAIGYNISGQCDVSGWTDIVTITCGVDYTMGLRSDGTVITTGNNTDGECVVSDWTGIAMASGGGRHTVGLKSDGTVVAVGDNEYGQCNVSDWTDIKLPSSTKK